MSIEAFTMLFGIMLVATITPGPATLFSLEVGAKHSISKTIETIVVISLIAVGFAIMALMGLSAIMLKYAMVYRILKIVGGIYLVYLGVQKFLSIRSIKETISQTSDTLRDNKNPIKQGTLIGLSNPKCIIFFAAVFPQFIPQKPTITLFVLLLTAVFVSSVVCLMLYAFLGRKILNFAKKPKASKLIESFSGMLYCAFGAVLLLSRD